MPICLYLVKPTSTAAGPANQYHVVNDTNFPNANPSGCALVGYTGDEFLTRVKFESAQPGTYIFDLYERSNAALDRLANIDASIAKLQAAAVAPGGSGVVVEPAAFSPAVAAQYYGFAFATTVMIWAVAYGAGQVIRMVRKG